METKKELIKEAADIVEDAIEKVPQRDVGLFLKLLGVEFSYSPLATLSP